MYCNLPNVPTYKRLLTYEDIFMGEYMFSLLSTERFTQRTSLRVGALVHDGTYE